MAHHKQAVKRIRQNERRAERNKDRMSRMRNIVRRVREAVSAGEVDQARTLLPEAVKVISRTGSKGIIHKAQASRRVSRLVRLVNKAVQV